MRWFGLLFLAWPSAASANFGPTAQIIVEPREAVVGQSVVFSSRGSVDPDSGPSPLRFDWSFNDGVTATGGEVTRQFLVPGAVRVTLTVSDGADSAVVDSSVLVLDVRAPGRSVNSGPLAMAGQGALWGVSPDSNSVTRLDLTTLETREVKVGLKPSSLAWDDALGLIYVACSESDTLWVLSAEGVVLRQIRTGPFPIAVVVAPVSGRVVVSEHALGALLVLEAGGESMLGRIALRSDPFAVAVSADGRSAFVSHFITRGATATVTAVDLVGLRKEREIELAEDDGPDTSSSGRGFPNLLGALAIEPSAKVLWAGGLKSNSGSGLRLRGKALGPTNWVRGFAARIDLENRREPIERRLDTNDADSVSGIAFTTNGRYAFLVHQGAGTLSVYDIPAMELSGRGDGSTVPFSARIDLCDAPRGAALADDGRRLFVSCFMSRTIAVIDVSRPTAPVLLRQVAVTAEALPAEVALGKRLFFSSREPLHSKSNYVACASCHPDGASDGRTWDTTQKGEGLRNTKDLRGRAGTSEGPLHWSANFDEVQDFERDIVEQFGGTGLAQDGEPPRAPLGASNAGRSRELDALAAFVSSLTQAPKSPYRQPDGTLTDAARRGRVHFLTARCDQCHSGRLFSDSTIDSARSTWATWDIGTLSVASGSRLGLPLVGIDTPGLLGVWASAPYLHDGSARSLRDVLTNVPLKAERLAGLSATDLDDLEQYLFLLDGRALDAETMAPSLSVDAAPRPCGCDATPAPLFGALTLLAFCFKRTRHV